ncbi:hypothetical protein A2635_03445 [Candidatus Peribacteria bacterium RIFCSPHIGHO2_01_FULL_51_9]|nr:MAG: hypothetical protein A2635_03445 [Candidatus Peribacteria bacterium RIFCSPHIGHO2_01_FULL_51_9]
MKTLCWTIATILLSPFLLLGSFLRRRKDVQKILIIQLGALGDLLCTTPLFRAIKETHPHTEIHVLCIKKSSIVLQGNPNVDQIHFYDATTRWGLIRQMRKEKFDWSINCLPGAFVSVVGLWSLIPNRINTPSQKHGILVRVLGIFSQYGLPYSLGTHTFDHYMDLAGFMGVRRVRYGIDFYPGEIKSNLPLKDGFVILSLTAGNSVKEWPLSKFVQLANYITTELGRDVILSTLDTKATQDVRSHVQRPDRVYDGSTLSLAELGDACRKAGAFVSVDTGPMYIAFAMGCPVVVVLGPIHPKEQIPPESDRVVHIPPPSGCTPWVHISLTPRKGSEEQLRCARDTSVEDVIEGLARVIR